MKHKTLFTLLPLALLLGACTNIKPGEVALVVPTAGFNREVTNSDVRVGRVWYNPLTTDLYTYPVTVSRIEYAGDNALRFQDRDGLSMGVDAALSVRVDRDKVPYIYNKYRKDADALLTGQLKDTVKNTFNRVAETYPAVELYGPRRSEFQDKASAQITQRLAGEGIIVEQLAFTGEMTVPAQVKAALERSQAATNQAIQAENELRTIKAEGQKTVAAAQAKAQASVLEAEGQAKANRIVAASLTPELVRLRQIERWNGKLPNVQAGTGSGLILDLTQGREAAPTAPSTAKK